MPEIRNHYVCLIYSLSPIALTTNLPNIPTTKLSIKWLFKHITFFKSQNILIMYNLLFYFITGVKYLTNRYLKT